MVEYPTTRGDFRMAKKAKVKLSEKVTKNIILETFVSFVKKNGRNPTEAELQKLGISRNAIRWHFDTVKDLKSEARKKNPDVFKHIIDESSFTKKNFAKLSKLTSKHERFVVTTAVAGCRVNMKFYKALKSYCKKNDALLLIIPVKDPAASVSSSNSWELDPIFAENNDLIVFGDLALNQNIYVSGIKMSAKQIDPTTGIDRLARSCSFIFGSPKWRLRVLPNAKNRHPHILMSTGAITIPNYDSEKYMSQRTGYLADFDHKMSALIVETCEKGLFHIRHLIAEPASGSFVDLSDYYHADGTVTRMDAELFNQGDLHAGEHDPTAMQAWKEICEVVKPRVTIQHDVFNGKSISPHEEKQAITRAKLFEKGMLSLEDELKLTAKVLSEIIEWSSEGVVMVKANHDDWIIRYLQSGRYLKEPHNFFMATELVEAVRRGEDPVAYGICKYLTSEQKKKVLFLERDQEYNIHGIENGVHGDKGPNGSRGTIANLEKVYGAGNFGHSHTPAILRDAWQHGCTQILDPDFVSGGSSWMHSSIIQYPNGSRQMIHSVRGKWRKKPKKKASKK